MDVHKVFIATLKNVTCDVITARDGGAAPDPVCGIFRQETGVFVARFLFISKTIVDHVLNQMNIWKSPLEEEKKAHK